VVYLDTNVVIYLLENHPVHGHPIAQKLTALKEEGESFVASTLLVTEFLAGTTGATFNDLSRFIDLEFKDVNLDIARQAADYQRKYGLLIGDAIHLATATELSPVSGLLTYDKQLAKAAAKHLTVFAA